MSWQVARVLVIRDDSTGVVVNTVYSVFCGGALLSKKYILSAAHCGPPTKGFEHVLIGAKTKYERDKIRELSKKYHTHDQYEEFDSATEGKLVIYDFGVCYKQRDKDIMKKFIKYWEQYDIENLSDLAHVLN